MEKKSGRLRIFLGFAPGVGKTYAMLEAAQAAQKQNTDVAIGYLEPHARPDTQAMAVGLEQIAPLVTDYKGIQIKELDLDAVLKRRPQILLIDEMAHQNPEGARHNKRYQDIEEVIRAGIDVYTTVNIQHLESLNDLVTGITKVRVKERIPDSVFDQADQVEIVDIEPDELLARLRSGKIYRASHAQRAMENFFSKEKLIALREIALRRMADRVNRLAEGERPARDREYTVGEHILTCISAAPSNSRVIRTASRLAYAFHGEFTALYVETPTMQNADRKIKRMLEENLQLARDLGARIATVFGEDIPYQIAEYARISNVSKVVIGRTNHKIYFGQTKGTLVERLTRYAPKLDVYVIPDVSEKEKDAKARRQSFPKQIRLMTVKADLLKTAELLAASTGIGFLFTMLKLPESNVIMIYILGVILCSLYTNGKGCSILASVLSVILFNFFFTESYGIFNPVTFIVMFAVAMVTSTLTVKMRRQSRRNAKIAYRTQILLENTRKLGRARSVEEAVRETGEQALLLLNLPVLIYREAAGKFTGPELFPRKGITKEDMKEYTGTEERAVALWVFQNHHRAGTCTSTLPGAKAIYLPVQNNEKVYAVVGIVLEERREIAPFEYGLLTAMLNEAALVLERFTR